MLTPAGELQMGSNDPGAENDEQPVHTVYVDAFYMDIHEVTNAQYKKFVDANPQWGKDRLDSTFHNGQYLLLWNGNDYPKGKANHPVVHVSWLCGDGVCPVGGQTPADRGRVGVCRAGWIVW